MFHGSDDRIFQDIYPVTFQWLWCNVPAAYWQITPDDVTVGFAHLDEATLWNSIKSNGFATEG